jgi:hypothetical protein
MFNEYKYNKCSRDTISSSNNTTNFTGTNISSLQSDNTSNGSVNTNSENTSQLNERSDKISLNSELLSLSGESYHKRNSFSVLKKSYFLLENEDAYYKTSSAMIMSCDRSHEGEVVVTNFRFIFNPKNAEFFQQEFILPEYFQIPFMYIQSVTKKKENMKYKYTLKLQLRDRPPTTIYFLNKKEYEHIYDLLIEKMSFKDIKSLFAFDYHRKYNNENFDQNMNGWSIYKNLMEYERMGVNMKDQKNNYRCMVQVMMDHNICETYPFLVYTHKSIADEEIEKVANFRSKKRFPALVWLSDSNKSSLWRSSQAKTGMTDKRSSHDETFFSTISSETEKFHIYDARPYINALANKFRGMGFENIGNYKNGEIIFCDIENIHAVRQAYNKLKIISQLPLY